MANETHVLFRGKLPSKAALTRAMKELGFPLAIKPATGSLERQSGFMPMLLRGEKETGVEFDVFDGSHIEALLGKDHDLRFERSASFRWGGDEDEMLCALCASAALARLVKGVVFEEGEGRLLSPGEAIADARRHLKNVVQAARRGTGPADIKRYLKPLLDQRSDLVLVGSLLVIRPVRHLLRGAFLEAENKDGFRVWHRCDALYDPQYGGSANDYIRTNAFAVGQPHFEPLLIGALGAAVFERVGKIVTLADFAAQPARRRGFEFAQVTSLVLAGERERAAALVEETERDAAAVAHGLGFGTTEKDPIREHWEGLVADIEATCAQCHAQEAAAIKRLKLEHIWEPTPFPVELPAAARAKRSAEPVFPTTPWPAPPPWLWQDVPQRPGEVRFAKDLLRRDEDVLLLVALAPEEAEKRHRELEDYVLATRLPDGLVLIVKHSTLQGRHGPPRPRHTEPRPRFSIELEGSSERVHASATTLFQGPDVVEITSIEVRKRAAPDPVWSGHFDLHQNEKSIHDFRSGRKVHSDKALTRAERKLVTFPKPGFGVHAVFAERVRSLLRSAGYGEVT